MGKHIEKLILTPETEYDEMIDDLRNGKKKGTTTYIDCIDPAWTWRETELNLITGYANEGKSEFLKQIILIKALEEKKKFAVYMPEDFPASEFFSGMIHTITGKPTDKDNKDCISEELYNEAYKLIKDLFIFLYIEPPHNTLEELVISFQDLLELHPDLYGFVIDPYIKVTRSKQAPERDDLYGAYFINLLGNFGRIHNKVTFLVMHQQTPKVSENTGLYAKPNKYSIKSGGTFTDTADNVLSIWRPLYAKDKIDTSVEFESQKIKKQKLVGVPQSVEIGFDRKTNRYIEKISGMPLYNFSKHLLGYKTKIQF